MFYTRGYFDDHITENVRKVFQKPLTNEQIDALMESFDYELITENLGVFKDLPRRLLSSFTDTTYGVKGSKLAAAYGQSSNITRVIFNNPTAIEKAMVDEKHPGLIVYVKGIPVMTVSYKTSSGTRYGATPGKWSGMSDDKAKYDLKFVIDVSAFKDDIVHPSLLQWEKEYYNEDRTMPKVKKAIAALMKASAYTVSAALVSADENRMKLQTGRAEAKKGALSLMKPEAVKKMLKDQLWSKLKAFKLSKSDLTLQKKEDISKHIVSKLPKTFAIEADGMKIYYKFKDARNINNAIEYAVKGADYGWHFNPEDCYFEFEIADPSRKEVSKRIEVESEVDGKFDADRYKEAQERIKNVFPGTIKVIVEVDGLTLKPSKIVYEKGWY